MRAVALVYRPSTLTPGTRVVAIWTQFTAWQRTWLIPGLLAAVVMIQAPVIWATCRTYTQTTTGSAMSGTPSRYWICDSDSEKPTGLSPGDRVWTTDQAKLYTWTGSTWQQMNTSGGGGGSPNVLSVDVDFGTGKADARATVTGQSWVTGTSKIICEPTLFATSSRAEGAEDALIEGLRAMVHTRSVGVGFTVVVAPSRGFAYGVYTINCQGA